MRIDGQAAIQKIAGARLKRLGAAEETAATGADSMELSTRAADINAAMDALKNAPEVREDRIADLTRQMENGSLALDGKSMAEKLLRKH